MENNARKVEAVGRLFRNEEVDEMEMDSLGRLSLGPLSLLLRVSKESRGGTKIICTDKRATASRKRRGLVLAIP